MSTPSEQMFPHICTKQPPTPPQPPQIMSRACQYTRTRAQRTREWATQALNWHGTHQRVLPTCMVGLHLLKGLAEDYLRIFPDPMSDRYTATKAELRRFKKDLKHYEQAIFGRPRFAFPRSPLCFQIEDDFSRLMRHSIVARYGHWAEEMWCDIRDVATELALEGKIEEPWVFLRDPWTVEVDEAIAGDCAYWADIAQSAARVDAARSIRDCSPSDRNQFFCLKDIAERQGLEYTHVVRVVASYARQDRGPPGHFMMMSHGGSATRILDALPNDHHWILSNWTFGEPQYRVLLTMAVSRLIKRWFTRVPSDPAGPKQYRVTSRFLSDRRAAGFPDEPGTGEGIGAERWAKDDALQLEFYERMKLEYLLKKPYEFDCRTRYDRQVRLDHQNMLRIMFATSRSHLPSAKRLSIQHQMVVSQLLKAQAQERKRARRMQARTQAATGDVGADELAPPSERALLHRPPRRPALRIIVNLIKQCDWRKGKFDNFIAFMDRSTMSDAIDRREGMERRTAVEACFIAYSLWLDFVVESHDEANNGSSV